MGSLAESLRARGRFDESEALSREVLAMRLALYDDTHPLVALRMNALGGALRGQERYDEAEVFYRKALSIRREAFGNAHKLTARSSEERRAGKESVSKCRSWWAPYHLKYTTE